MEGKISHDRNEPFGEITLTLVEVQGGETGSLLSQEKFFTPGRRPLLSGEVTGDLLQSVPHPERSVVLTTALLETPGDLLPVAPGVGLLLSVVAARQALLLRS